MSSAKACSCHVSAPSEWPMQSDKWWELQFLQYIHVWATNTVTFSRQRMASLLPHPNLHSPPSLFPPPSPSASSSRLSTSLLCGQFQRNNHNYKKRCQQRSLRPSLHFLPAQQNRDKWITASFVVMPALWWQMVHQSSLTLSALALMNVTV